MDEAYLKIKGEDVYLYRAVDKLGNTIDFMLSKNAIKKRLFASSKRLLDNLGYLRK